MPIARKQLSSPLTGEGSGGGRSRATSPHPNLPPPGGKGCVPPPVSPRRGKGLIGERRFILTLTPTLLHQGEGLIIDFTVPSTLHR
jgi:hypothetical protein